MLWKDLSKMFSVLEVCLSSPLIKQFLSAKKFTSKTAAKGFRSHFVLRGLPCAEVEILCMAALWRNWASGIRRKVPIKLFSLHCKNSLYWLSLRRGCNPRERHRPHCSHSWAPNHGNQIWRPPKLAIPRQCGCSRRSMCHESAHFTTSNQGFC